MGFYQNLKCILISSQNIINGQEKNLDIQPQVPVFKIPEIFINPHFDLFRIGNFTPVPVYLGPPGDALRTGEPYSHLQFLNSR